jgi:hypothetical protein
VDHSVHQYRGSQLLGKFTVKNSVFVSLSSSKQTTTAFITYVHTKRIPTTIFCSKNVDETLANQKELKKLYCQFNRGFPYEIRATPFLHINVNLIIL